MSVADTSLTDPSGSSGWLTITTALAPLPVVGLVGMAWSARRPEIGVGLAGMFLVWYVVLFVRWRRGSADAWSATPLLVFWAALVPCLESVLRGGRGTPVVGLADFLPVMAGLAVGHALLLGLAHRPRSTCRALPVLAAVWIAGAWLLSTGLQVLRFELFLPVGFPEDTAYLWDCFRSWQAGGAIASEWSLTWHDKLVPFFSLHFSPVVVPVFEIVRLRPSLSTLLIAQNVFVGAGILLWGWVMHRWWARPGANQPSACSGTTKPAAGWLGIAALFITHPGIGAAMRNELHPILWAIGPLAMLHHAWLWRHRWRFGLWAISLFLFREDLGLGVSAYAFLSWVDGRRAGSDRFWSWVPLLGVVGSGVVMGGIMPRFGGAGGDFFQSTFDTATSGWVGFGVWLLAHPGELVARVFRPGHIVLAAQLIATGLALPLRSPQWLPALPYIAVYSVLSRRLDLIRLGSHYVVLPALYLAIATVDSASRIMHRWRPERRFAAGVVVWTLCAVQPVNVFLPPLGRLTDLATYRAELRSDLALIEEVDRVFVPVNLLSGTTAKQAMPLHLGALQYADRHPDRAPRAALLPAEDPSLIGNWHHIEPRYRVGAPIRVGTHYSLYPLE